MDELNSHISRLIDFEEFVPPEDQKKVMMYEKQSTVGTLEPFELTKKSSEAAITSIKTWNLTIKDLLLIRALHIFLSIDLPNVTIKVPLPVQRQLLEGFLT